MLAGDGRNRLVLENSVSNSLANSPWPVLRAAHVTLPSVQFERYDCPDDMAAEPAPAPLRSTGRVTIEELAAAQGVMPMESNEEWVAEIFESDEELEAFLADVRSSRNASLA